MGFSMNDGKWMEMFHLLEEYVECKGNLPGRLEVYRGVNLGVWVTNQKSFYKRGTLSEARRACLERVGLGEMGAVAPNQMRWMMKFDLLKEYMQENGSLPSRSVVYKNVCLGTWLSSQKMQFRRGEMPSFRADLFHEIGVNLGVTDYKQRWIIRFELLKAYMREAGGEPRWDTVCQETQIGQWLINQKFNYRNGSLSSERQVLLEDIGVDLEHSALQVRDECWSHKMGLLREYVALNGGLPERDTEYEGVAIGQWLKEKVNAFQAGRLPDYRWEDLCEFGDKVGVDLLEIDWTVKGRASLDEMIASAENKRVVVQKPIEGRGARDDV